MNTKTFCRQFATIQKTIEDAQAFYKYNPFNPAAVFELPDGGFVLAFIREQGYPPHKTARALEELLGYKMVSCCDPLLGVWKPYVKIECTCQNRPALRDVYEDWYCPRHGVVK